MNAEIDTSPPPQAATPAPSPASPETPVPQRPTARFMLRHPAHVIALGFGSGLSPIAPGTVGTLWAWLAFLVMNPWLTDMQWGLVLAIGAIVGWWACTLTARHLGVADPGAIVWDEVIAFWAVLWLVMPEGLWGQVEAFVIFRVFDALKPGPVAWADRLFKARRGRPIGYAQGFGILFDDLIAALCTLLVISLWRWIW